MKRVLFALGILIGVIGAYGEPVSSNIGGRNITLSQEVDDGVSAKSYVQDGLIAQWDGIENIGYGRHDGASIIWVDLIGNRTATLTEHGAFSDDALVSDGIGWAAADGKCFHREGIGQVEIAFHSESEVVSKDIAQHR